MEKTTLHMIGMFYTICNHDYDHCAFTGKVWRFAKMMKMQGYKVIEYSNGNSMSEANEHIQILTEEELLNCTKTKDFVTNNIAMIGSSHWTLFNEKLIKELSTRVKPYDIICHAFGSSHESLIQKFPYAYHVETGIGYIQQDFGAFRIFESYTWMHYNQGNYRELDKNGNVKKDDNGNLIIGRQGNAYEWVIPNYYDLNDWEPNYEKGDYLLYFGRIIEGKGLYIIKEIAKHITEPIKIAGLGNIDKFRGQNIEFIGPITGSKPRSDLLRNARAIIVPTIYTEPFGGVAVEAMLCGTPVISSDYGAFVETVEHGKTGFRCHTLGDYLTAISAIKTLNRKYIADRAREKWSLETVGKQYDAVFKQIADLQKDGWYTLQSHIINID